MHSILCQQVSYSIILSILYQNVSYTPDLRTFEGVFRRRHGTIGACHAALGSGSRRLFSQTVRTLTRTSAARSHRLAMEQEAGLDSVSSHLYFEKRTLSVQSPSHKVEAALECIARSRGLAQPPCAETLHPSISQTLQTALRAIDLRACLGEHRQHKEPEASPCRML